MKTLNSKDSPSTSVSSSTKAALWATAFTVFFLVGWAILFHYNDYLRERPVHVTFVDRGTDNRCHKSRCDLVYVGIYQTDEGQRFYQDISEYQYRQMHLNEQFMMTLRPMDIKQTPKDNLIWVFGYAMWGAMALTLTLMTTIGWIVRWRHRVTSGKTVPYEGPW